MFDEPFWKYFFELFESFPRQGPGLDVMTARALGCLPPLTSEHRVLDIGCGAGMQTLEIARKSEASLTAVDIHAPFIEMLNRRAAQEGLAGRISGYVADMNDLPFPDGTFDVLWAEGSIFILGFARGLTLWRRLLKPGGYLVVSELTWFSGNIPAELHEFCMSDPEEDASLEARRRAIEETGYRLIEEFPLPREGWWEAFYAPMFDRLDAFEERHKEHPEALAVVERCRYEIDLFHRYADLYGYTFFIMQR